MAEKRRLPVIPSGPERNEPVEQTPPPWHWVPIGVTVIIAVAAVLGFSFWAPYSQHEAERIYGAGHTPEERARIAAHTPVHVLEAFRFRLMLAGAAIMFVSLLVGGFVVARYGTGTNARHGTLAGILAMALLMLVADRTAHSFSEVAAYATLVPFGGLVGYLGGRIGEAMRMRAHRNDSG